MKTTLRTGRTIGDICAGFEFSEAEGKGLYGLSGKLTIQPEYQRHYLYAEQDGKPNCPMCAESGGSNAKKIWSLKDMDADHVTAWSKGGETSAANCQMLCKHHNRLKGNL